MLPLTNLGLVLFAPVASALWNPIIPGFNPDPAILRDGNDYYIATSTFEYYPGLPIYHSTDLANWTLHSHALTRPAQLQLWHPDDGRCLVTQLSQVQGVWADPWGIDPELFNDPVTRKACLNLMAPNNNQERLLGVWGCEVSLSSGGCIGDYKALWNDTLPVTGNSRPEGPKKTLYRKSSCSPPSSSPECYAWVDFETDIICMPVAAAAKASVLGENGSEYGLIRRLQLVCSNRNALEDLCDIVFTDFVALESLEVINDDCTDFDRIQDAVNMG